MTLLSTFDHVTLAVHDIDEAVETYALLLGKQPSWRGAHPELGSSAALFAFSNTLLELVAPLKDAEEAEGLRALLAAQGEGIQAMAFGTADAAACRSQLLDKGVRTTAPQAGVAHASDGSTRHYRVLEVSPKVTRGLPVLIVERADLTQLLAAPAARADVFTALDHVVVASADMAAVRASYEVGLGLRLSLEGVVGDQRLLFFRVGGVTFEVVERPALGDRDQFYGLAYRVRDLEAAHARLRATGLTLGEVGPGKKAGTRVFTVKSGTCGVRTLVIEDPSRSYADR